MNVSKEVEIVEYSDLYKSSFKELNYEWIEKYFEVEATDIQVLLHPDEEILSKGGFIYFAKCGEEIVGTFALIKVDDQTYELAKMAVTEKYRNKGIGKLLVHFAIQKASSQKKNRLILYSNRSLSSAIRIYKRFGFKEIPKTDFHANRSNIKMEKWLNINSNG